MLSELRTFIAVVRYGSFAKAGEHIGLTQGAVSAQIQHLEQHVGLRLFDRRARRAVEKGIGVGIVPITAAHYPFPAGVRMLPLGKHAFSREIGIAERGTLTHPLLTRRLINLLAQSATASAIALPTTPTD